MKAADIQRWTIWEKQRLYFHPRVAVRGGCFSAFCVLWKSVFLWKSKNWFFFFPLPPNAPTIISRPPQEESRSSQLTLVKYLCSSRSQIPLGRGQAPPTHPPLSNNRLQTYFASCWNFTDVPCQASSFAVHTPRCIWRLQSAYRRINVHTTCFCFNSSFSGRYPFSVPRPPTLAANKPFFPATPQPPHPLLWEDTFPSKDAGELDNMSFTHQAILWRRPCQLAWNVRAGYAAVLLGILVGVLLMVFHTCGLSWELKARV